MESSIPSTIKDVTNVGDGGLNQRSGVSAWLQTIRYTVQPASSAATTMTVTNMGTFEAGE